MCQKNDNPNLTQSLVVYFISVYLISLVASIHGRPKASIAASFRQSAGFVLFQRLSFSCLNCASIQPLKKRENGIFVPISKKFNN